MFLFLLVAIDRLYTSFLNTPGLVYYYVHRILAWKFDFVLSSNNGDARATAATLFLKSLRVDNDPSFFCTVVEIRDMQWFQ